jgi:hypothetical protein
VISEQPGQETASGTRKGGAIDNAFQTEVNLFPISLNLQIL